MHQPTLKIPTLSKFFQFKHTTTISTINGHTHTKSHRQITRSQHTTTETNTTTRKPRILCLHGFRTSGQILKTQLNKWPQSLHQNINLFFPDAPFPSTGKSGVEHVFDPPYYEWFQFNKDYLEYENFDECVEYIEECMMKYGPIDGLLGFSQGAILAAALPGLQAKGLALTRVPKIRFIVIISGAKLKNEALAEKAYSLPIPSLHFLGNKDILKPYGTELLKSFENPTLIHHPQGHTIPRLDERGLDTMLKFIDSVQNFVSLKEEIVARN